MMRKLITGEGRGTNLLQMQTYWVEAYKVQNLRNVCEDARIERIELARPSNPRVPPLSKIGA